MTIDTVNNRPRYLSIQLDSGTLRLDLEPGRIPIHRLLGYASRIGSKRKFLLVSKILGKHYPVSPVLMAWSYRALARSILSSGIHGSSLWIGMAETATGLGYGTYEAACREGIGNPLFMQTTRYHLDGAEGLKFDETHSHATDFYLYMPTEPALRERFQTATTLVLIDDEISTGRTFSRLIQAYRTVNPKLRKVVIASLVNFASREDRRRLAVETGIDVAWIALRQGQLHFDGRPNQVLDGVQVNVSGNGDCKRPLLGWPGRLGIVKPVKLFEVDVAVLLSRLRQPSDQRPVLVLGTGECNAPAYLIGRQLERHGLRVKVQSTTRSPIHVGNDIASVCRFEDNYDDNISNFLYNLNHGEYRDIVLCHETPLNGPLLDRLHAWQAISARIEIQPSNPHAKLHFFRPG